MTYDTELCVKGTVLVACVGGYTVLCLLNRAELAGWLIVLALVTLVV